MLALLAAGCAVPDEGPWRLVWSDEFTGPEGSAPDPASWTPQIGGDGWGNDQLEYDRAENADLDGNGFLRITARREDFGGRQWTSARLASVALR
jgi:hypothetical protein